MKNKHKAQRLLRLWFPKGHDHAAWLLMNAVGRWWFLLTGWQREYRLILFRNGRWHSVMIDLAQPRLKLALEADGERYHMDIVHEQERNELLQAKGWTVKHYRYPKLKDEPRTVKREVRRWYWQSRMKQERPSRTI